MKKALFALGFVTFLASCGGGSTETEGTTTDSTTVVVDSVKSVDTTKACCDTTKTVDSTKEVK